MIRMKMPDQIRNELDGQTSLGSVFERNLVRWPRIERRNLGYLGEENADFTKLVQYHNMVASRFLLTEI